MSSAVDNYRGSRFAPIHWRDMSCKLNTEWLTKTKRMPKSQRLLLKCLEKEISEKGVTIQIKNGDPVRAVAVQHVRNGYVAANAQQTEPGEDENKFIDRQCKSFGRAFDALVQSKAIVATEFKEETFLWTP